MLKGMKGGQRIPLAKERVMCRVRDRRNLLNSKNFKEAYK